MCDKGTHHEHITAHVDDSVIASRTPGSIVDALVNKRSFKLKGTGPAQFHSACDFFRDEKGALRCGPKKRIEKILENHRCTFGT